MNKLYNVLLGQLHFLKYFFKGHWLAVLLVLPAGKYYFQAHANYLESSGPKSLKSQKAF